jgi:hypothetical protein
LTPWDGASHFWVVSGALMAAVIFAPLIEAVCSCGDTILYLALSFMAPGTLFVHD